MFEPIDGRRGHVRDAETGVELIVQSIKDYSELVSVNVPRRCIFKFVIQIASKYPERTFTAGDPSNPTILILMGSLKRAAESYGGSFEENTHFVRLILNGLSTINRLWPFSRNPYFYSDRERYMEREDLFPFILPSVVEIASL